MYNKSDLAHELEFEKIPRMKNFFGTKIRTHDLLTPSILLLPVTLPYGFLGLSLMAPNL